MKKSMKKIVSALFAMAMLMNIMAVTAFATDATPTVAPTAAPATDAAATTAPTEEAGGAVTYEGSYNAYMGIQTDTKLWIFRNSYDDPTYGFGTEEFKGLSSVADGATVKYNGTFTDAVIDGDGTYTVTLTDPDLSTEEHLSLLYVSTDIPLSDAIKVTNVIVKFDGSTKYTFDEAVVDKDSKTYVKFLMLNAWNDAVKDIFSYNIKAKKIEVTFTIEGFGYKSTQVAATPTVAAAAEDTKTDNAATTDDSAKDDAAKDDAAGDKDDKDGLSTPVIIAIIAGAVVVVGIVVVVVRKKK